MRALCGVDVEVCVSLGCVEVYWVPKGSELLAPASKPRLHVFGGGAGLLESCCVYVCEVTRWVAGVD